VAACDGRRCSSSGQSGKHSPFSAASKSRTSSRSWPTWWSRWC
jgi:hypothetical protein